MSVTSLDETANKEQLHLPAQSSGDLSAEAARKIAIAAQAEFAATAEVEGKRAALKTFNSRVSNWANQFTDKRLTQVRLDARHPMKGETHSFHITEDKLCRMHQQAPPGAHVDKATGKPRLLRGRTIRRYTEALEKAGIITVERTGARTRAATTRTCGGPTSTP